MTADLAELPHSRLTMLRRLEIEPREGSARAALLRRLGRAWVDAGRSHLAHRRFVEALAAFGSGLRYRGYRMAAVKNLLLFPLQAPLYWLKGIGFRQRTARAVASLWSLVPIWEIPICEIPV